MQQYLDLLKKIREEGTYKSAAREGMPGTYSLFGYQFRHDLSKGFPLLTTKKMFWKGVVIELLWFLRGDTNIKFLVDNGVNIWNEDAYNYFKKVNKEKFNAESEMPFEKFIEQVKKGGSPFDGYTWGDCGFQYGKVWRKWQKNELETVDQIKNLISGLREHPESRRHIVTAIDPAHDNDLALYWCHAMFQFNCRPLSYIERSRIAIEKGLYLKENTSETTFSDDEENKVYVRKSFILNIEKIEKEMPSNFEKVEDYIISFGGSDKMMDHFNIPKYYLDCQLYQRSADVFLGVPFNIASYALLTHIIADMCNMIPGKFIHTFGDVHIYENHMDAVNEQLTRTPDELPQLKIMFKELHTCDWEAIQQVFNKANETDFQIMNYNPQSSIKAELSTGLKK